MGVEDAERRHGRKLRRLLGDGSKHHVLHALDSRLVVMVAVEVMPAKAPETSMTDTRETNLAVYQDTLPALPINWAYVSRKLGQQRSEARAILAGQYVQVRIFLRAYSTWMRNGTPCGVRVER